MSSLEDRISEPTAAAVNTAPTETEAPNEASWADDDNGQMDGATSFAGGNSLPESADYEVDVKLIDEDNPLYSVKSFEDLGL